MGSKKSMLTAGLILMAIFSASARGQTLSISPSSQDVSLYSKTTASVNVSISSVTNLYGYQFDILYNNAVLNMTPTGTVKGPFIGTASQTFWISPNISAQGLIRNIACTRTGTTNVSGSGSLAMLTFDINMNVVTPATSTIGISGQKLSNMYSQPIPATVMNGTITIRACLSGETRSCNSNIGECRSGTLTCNSSNQWPISSPSTCVGSVWSTNEVCDGKDNNCNGQSDENATGSGNLSRSCSATHYGICAVGNEICNGVQYAGCPLPQAEICFNGIDEDCNGADSTCKGDINGDGCIDITDLSAVASKFGLRTGDAGWDATRDIVSSGEIDIFDLVAVGKDFGVGCT